MKIETKTSVYDLTLDLPTGELVLKKKMVKSGAMSRVSTGQEFRGDKVEITPQGLVLYRGNKIILSTSRLVNL
ncbi:hypothetical protein AMJ50_02695 [Parcubacteria bacterium DG_74_3]|nr:MAG: hypothetical protein AMJ50_02695 [Parcubacteria bacterium DG_74_3]